MEAFSPHDLKSDRELRPTYRQTRSIFLRGLGLTYMAAFASMAVQVDGLIGSQGILPAAEFFERARNALGPHPKTYWLLPSLLWFNSSDHSLHALCWGGVFLGALLFSGILPGFCTAVLWLAYLSISVGGQIFLGYQWDNLLLETGLLAILMAPWNLRLNRATDQPWPFTVWLVRWLVFRLMFMSGLSKLMSQDPTWWSLSALDFHYETQPLPSWTSWYIHQMPLWFHRISVCFMFYAELVAPVLILGTRGMRRVCFASLALLQLLIAATGNYGFFNLLSLVLCTTILDDRDWDWLRDAVRRNRSPIVSALGSEPNPTALSRQWSLARRVMTGTVGAVLIGATAQRLLERIWPGTDAPFPLPWLADGLEPLRSTNSYGLFAVMTTERREIIIEGSNDGVTWQPYHLRWKPDEPDRSGGFMTPHMPRLDWQLWFAALYNNCRAQPWFLNFEQRLLSGSPPVLALLRENPFPDQPPRFVRARLYIYKFTRYGSPNWWDREEKGLYCPPMEN
jgi:lipase maturation factor 1